MSTSNTKLPSKLQSKLDAAISGLTNSNLAMLNSLIILGTALSKAEVIARLKSFSQLFVAVTVTRQAYSGAVVARKVAMPSVHTFFTAFEATLKQALGPSNQGLLPTFGSSVPRTKKVATPEAKAIAQVKAAATRKARGTKGRQQALAIKATPDMVVQVVAPPGPSQSTAPVSPATPVPASEAAPPKL